MVKCKRCKQAFMSNIAYTIHVRMREKVGRKIVCPTVERLRAQEMDNEQYGQWLFVEKV